jgi:heat shock protein HslJ
MHVFMSSPPGDELPRWIERLTDFQLGVFWRQANKEASGRVLTIAFLIAMVGGSAMGQTTQLVGSQWRLVRIDAMSVPNDSQASIRFETKDRVVGNGGCNRFFGTYKTSDHEILFSSLNYTRMACPGLIMDREQALFDALAKARSFQLAGTELRLLDANNHELALLIQAS